MCIINFIKILLLKLSKQLYIMLEKSVHPLETIYPLTTYSNFRKDHYYFFALLKEQ